VRNVFVKFVGMMSLILALLGIWNLAQVWLLQPLRLNSSAISQGLQSTNAATLLNLSFGWMMGSGFLLMYGFPLEFPFVPRPEYGLLIQAYRDAGHAMHRQAKDLIWLRAISLFVMFAGLMLGEYWRSGFYLLYTAASLVFFFGTWRQAELSDRLAQSR
jgi:hypothetical protein